MGRRIWVFEIPRSDQFHELTDPSLDELEDILNRLEEDASSSGDLNLRQAILFAQILIQDIKQKIRIFVPIVQEF